MARPHAKLRGAMVAADMDEEYLARKLLRGRTYVSQRMMGRKPWPMDEAYAIMDLIRAPYDQLTIYFPPKGA
jgi:hypothetical protein